MMAIFRIVAVETTRAGGFASSGGVVIAARLSMRFVPRRQMRNAARASRGLKN